MQRRMVGLLENCKGFESPNRGTCLEGLRKTKTRLGGRYPGKNWNQVCLEFKYGTFPLHTRRVPLENCLPANQGIPHLFVSGRFITVFTEGCHCSLFWARWIWHIPSRPIYWRSTLISSCLHVKVLRVFSFVHVFPLNSLWTSSPPPRRRRACPLPCLAQHAWYDHANYI